VVEPSQFQEKRELIRKRLLKYTRKAFLMLPGMDKPKILDIGCGSGVPTIELARMSDGEITGLDIDRDALDVLSKKIARDGLSDKIKVINCSITDMVFPDGSFDIIWSEGSIFVVGFQKGLQEWQRFLKPNGFMAIHDEQGNITQKLKQISENGYELLDYFLLDKEIWWTEYFAPLQKLVDETRIKSADDSEILAELDNSQREIDIFQNSPERNRSVFFVIKRSR
jgi:ubiquinone/menaquinone biosynthesis C-methylase UbiE